MLPLSASRSASTIEGFLEVAGAPDLQDSVRCLRDDLRQRLRAVKLFYSTRSRRLEVHLLVPDAEAIPPRWRELVPIIENGVLCSGLNGESLNVVVFFVRD